MYGTWFGLVFGGLIVLAALIGLSLLASPLIGFFIAAIIVAVIAGLIVARRGARHSAGSGASPGPGKRSSFEGGPAPPPRSGGAPVSGEGEAHGGEAASRP